jgi:membrane protein implicated in regulation of membrane protease activity
VAAEAGAAWWPLLISGVGACGWTLMVGMRHPPPAAQAATAVIYGGGGITYGVLADDVAAIAVGVVGALALAGGFPPLHRWTRKLVDQQPSTGMESLVGRTATVETGAEGRPVVRIDGSLWSISAPAVAPGTTVVVRGWRGFVLDVEPRAPRPGVPSPPS